MNFDLNPFKNEENNFFSAMFIIGILISGCSKKAEKANPLFVGYWWASTAQGNYTLIINNNSEASYTIERSMESPTVYSGLAKIHNDKMKIGNRNFHIDIEPSVSECGAYTLVLDGVELRK